MLPSAKERSCQSAWFVPENIQLGLAARGCGMGEAEPTMWTTARGSGFEHFGSQAPGYRS